MMKFKDCCRKLGLFLCVAASVFVFTGCFKNNNFVEEQLFGKWYCQKVGLYYTFNIDRSGRYNDKENSGKDFTWTLSKEVLEIKVKGDGINVIAYETYIITYLSEDVMECHEEGYSETYKFERWQ